MLLVLVSSTMRGPALDQYYYEDGVDVVGLERDFRRRRLMGDVSRYAIRLHTFGQPVEHHLQNILDCAILHKKKIKGKDVYVYEVHATVVDREQQPMSTLPWTMTIGSRTFTGRVAATKTAMQYRVSAPPGEDLSKWQKPERLSRTPATPPPIIGFPEFRRSLALAWDRYHRHEERLQDAASSSRDSRVEPAPSSKPVYQ